MRSAGSIFFLALIQLAISSSRLAADPGAPPATSTASLPIEGEDWEAGVAELPATLITAAYLPRFGSDGFGIASIDLRHVLLFGYGEYPPLEVTPGVAMHRWSGPGTLDLPEAVYDAYLDLHVRAWESELSAISFGLTPGLFGDFERVDSQTYQWSGWMLANRHLGPEWTLSGGVAYVRQLRGNWLPIGGAVWTPSDATRLELIFPRPRIARRLASRGVWTHWGYVAGKFGGGAWSVADTPEQNVLVGYSDLRLLGGWEAFSAMGREWRGEIGYVFGRDITVDDTVVDSPSGSLVAEWSFAF